MLNIADPQTGATVELDALRLTVERDVQDSILLYVDGTTPASLHRGRGDGITAQFASIANAARASWRDGYLLARGEKDPLLWGALPFLEWLDAALELSSWLGAVNAKALHAEAQAYPPRLYPRPTRVKSPKPTPGAPIAPRALPLGSTRNGEVGRRDSGEWWFQGLDNNAENVDMRFDRLEELVKWLDGQWGQGRWARAGDGLNEIHLLPWSSGW